MLNENVELKICPIAQSLSVLGDAWSMLILRDAHDKAFGEFSKRRIA